MYKLAELFQQSSSFAEYAKGYNSRLMEVLSGVDLGAFSQAVEVIDKASRERRSLYLVANGGSAGVAAHMVNDLVAGSYVEGQPPFRVFSLTDNVATMTALANDVSYPEIFACQLRVYLAPGDVVLAMSVSGNSENIVRAVDYARAHDAVTIGFCGFDGGKLAGVCDIAVRVPATKDEYGPVEDSFGVLSHILSGYLTMQRGKWLHH
jgi:D-sedoheptulose 7-phosphate isomerase